MKGKSGEAAVLIYCVVFDELSVLFNHYNPFLTFFQK